MANLIVSFVCVVIFAQSFSAGQKPPIIGGSKPHLTNSQNDRYISRTNLNQCKLHLRLVCDSNSPMIRIPEGYEGSTELGYHKLHKKLTTWHGARQICHDEGAYLAIPESEEEAQKMIMMINEAEPACDNPQTAAWIGLHDIFKEGDWVTIFNDSISSIRYDMWTKKWGGGPDSVRHPACATMNVSGGIDDVPCDETRWFICEYTHSEKST